MSMSYAVRAEREKQVLSKVPEITAYFWIAKILTTGMGEVFSDFVVFHMNQYLAVVLGAVALGLSLLLQFAVKRYIAWVYWLVVVMVSVFGTMCADAAHIGLGVPYIDSTIFFAIVLAIVFVVWWIKERTLSIHSITSKRREFFYWTTVLVTFALGTASGDMTATTMHLGYFSSGILFTILLLIPAIGYGLFRLNGIFAFWFAYIMTRPVGASFSDWISVPHSMGGLDLGRGMVSLVLTIIIVLIVGYLQITRRDVQE